MGPVHRVFRKRNTILEGASAKAEKCRNIPGNAVQSEPPGFALMRLGDGVPFNGTSHPGLPLCPFSNKVMHRRTCQTGVDLEEGWGPFQPHHPLLLTDQGTLPQHV